MDDRYGWLGGWLVDAQITYPPNDLSNPTLSMPKDPVETLFIKYLSR